MKFLTFLNSGCITICKNMLISAEKVGLNPDDFIIACLDDNAFNEFKSYKNAYLAMNHPITSYVNWSYDSDSEFRQIIKHKWSLIAEHHAVYKNLCYIDTDIAFKNNPLIYIEDPEKMLFQKTLGPDDESIIDMSSSLCSGFMVFNDTVKCHELVKECNLAEHCNQDDQLLINEIALSEEFVDSIRLLPVVKFPLVKDVAGLSDENKRDAVLYHAAGVVGVQAKIEFLKNNGLWYIKETT